MGFKSIKGRFLSFVTSVALALSCAAPSAMMTVGAKDDTTTIEVDIIKQDVFGENLSGAQLSLTGENENGTIYFDQDCIADATDVQIINSSGEELSWFSGTGSLKIKLSDGEYKLTEKIPPQGYALASDVKFKIENGKLYVDGEERDTLDVIMVDEVAGPDEPDRKEFKISKVDIASQDELPGASLAIYKDSDMDSSTNMPKQGAVSIVSWVSTTGPKLIQDDTLKKFEPGAYWLVETGAPDGYAYASSQRFEIVNIDDTIKLDSNNNIITMEDHAIDDIKISKIGVSGSAELTGAELKVTYEENNQVIEVDSWTSGNTPHVIPGSELKAGTTYTLTETAAPDGYAYSESIEFTIEKDGTLSSNYIKDGIVTMQDKPIKDIEISKKSTSGSNEVEGATLTVTYTDKNGKPAQLDAWVSDKTPHVISGDKLVVGTKYTLTETNAPKGYTYSEAIEFVINKDGTVSSDYIDNGVITMKDKPIDDVIISKTDIGGSQEIEGAKLTITYEEDDKTVTLDSWTSGKTNHVIPGNKFTANTVYTLTETAAPNGYAYSESIDFKIDKDGNVIVGGETKSNRTVVMEDGLIKEVKISKVDIANDEELEGAELTIYAKDDITIAEDGSVTVKEGKASIISWISTKEVYEVDSKLLESGKTYVLVETGAPDGYIYTSNIEFSIGKDGVITSDALEAGIIVMKDEAIGDIEISKVAVGGGSELGGAELTVIDSNGDEVDSWISVTGEKHVISGSKLKVNETYTLTEVTAPMGYEIAESIAFTIEKDGTITRDGEIIDNRVIVMVDEIKTVSITINKMDVANSEEVEGAKIELFDDNNDKIDEWVSEKNEVHTFKDLISGVEYTLKETITPDGYIVATNIVFTIDYNGDITIISGKDGSIDEKTGILIINNTLKTVDIEVDKRDIANDEEIEGAELTILDENNEIVDKWISEKGNVHKVKGLIPNKKYTLKETTTPDGYETIESNIIFIVDEDGKIAISSGKDGSVDEKTGILIVNNTLKTTSVTINKMDIANGEEIEGAVITIYDEDDNIFDEWESKKDETKVIEGLIPGKEYVLKETTTPDGYNTIESDIVFTVDENGNVTVISGADGTVDEETGILIINNTLKTTSITVNKVDITNDKEVEGATLTIYDSENNIVDEWISKKEEVHEIHDLIPEKEYVLKETITPDGYITATNTTFTVDENGKITVISGNDAVVDEDGVLIINNTLKKVEKPEEPEEKTTSVTINKKDITNDEEVDGAKLELFDKDGNKIDEWISETGKTWTIEGLNSDEEYTLRETITPDGYETATDVVFTVDEDSNVTVVKGKDGSVDKDGILIVNDTKKKTEEKTTSVTINKMDIANSEEVEGAKLQAIDKDGNIIDEWISKKGETHTIENLIPDEKYTLREIITPDGYETATDTVFTVDEDGKVTVISGDDAIVEDNILIINDTKKEITTEDEETTSDETSTSEEETPDEPETSSKPETPKKPDTPQTSSKAVPNNQSPNTGSNNGLIPSITLLAALILVVAKKTKN